MLVKILGSAAGGAFPQWNCGCVNCSAVRAGKLHGKARSQTQVAISHNGVGWFLLGASPDLRMQIEDNAFLHPSNGVRNSPVRGVVLASADLDHVLGLLLLRELQPFTVYSTASVMRILRGGNSMFGMLNRVPDQVSWKSIAPGSSFELMEGDRATGLRCDVMALSGRYPAYATGATFQNAGNGVATDGLVESEASVGVFVTSSSGKSIAFLPAVSRFDDELVQRLADSDVVMIDGTFWSDDELIRVHGSGKNARDMGHCPVGSSGGTLAQLRTLSQPRKLFIHINNTNPMLDAESPEHRAVLDAGWEIAEDGWQLEV
jgi:pyrroloquinoline quinone biosynthesis protein B